MQGGIGIFLVGRAIKTEVKVPEYSVDFLTTSAPDFYTLTRQIYRWSTADFLHTFNDIFLFTLPPVVFSKTRQEIQDSRHKIVYYLWRPVWHGFV